VDGDEGGLGVVLAGEDAGDLELPDPLVERGEGVGQVLGDRLVPLLLGHLEEPFGVGPLALEPLVGLEVGLRGAPLAEGLLGGLAVVPERGGVDQAVERVDTGPLPLEVKGTP
jgi:hypothetical protein